MRVIAGAFGSRKLRTTSGPGYRPATGRVRESVFSMLESLGVDWPRARVADIFAGSGALGIEALSRGAELAVFVEKAAQAANLIRVNLEELGVEGPRWFVIKKDALRWLQELTSKPYDLVFVDPPYGKGLLLPTVDLMMKTCVLAVDGLLCAEVEAGLRLAASPHPDLELVREKTYGQTRICIWRKK